MQQMALMAKQQTAKSQDPITAALGGSTDAPSAGSSGVKGCLAREAFLKLMLDLPKYAQTVTANAASELGLEVHQIGPGLMREYIEKRSPLGDNRALIQNAYLWAWAWETGYKLNNPELMGVACRGLVFTDQTAIDYGRTNLSWLLTTLPEPQYHVVQRNRQRSSLTPFSRLASPSWIGANVAFMKDLDFLETKIRSANTGPKPTTNAEAAEEGPKKPWRPKKKKAAAGAGSDASQT